MQLEDSSARLQRVLQTLPIELQRTRPQPDQWSAAEVLEHVALVEGVVVQMLARAARELPPDSAPVAPLDVRVLTDRSKRIETTPRALPSGKLDSGQGWAKLRKSREAFLRLTEELDPEVWPRIRAPHFVFGTLDGFDWLRFLAGHEERHSAQIEEIAAALLRGSGDSHREEVPR
jgi:DinB family protein